MFDILHQGDDLPVLAFKLKENVSLNFNVYDLSERLRMNGWQVPAYAFPKNLESIDVMRIVIKEGMSLALADGLLYDIRRAVKYFEDLKHPISYGKKKSSGFHH